VAGAIGPVIARTGRDAGKVRQNTMRRVVEFATFRGPGPLRSQTAPRQQIDRLLVAILAADIAGYSRLMGADEETDPKYSGDLR
jgi:class 3 adenylate cyclase